MSETSTPTCETEKKPSKSKKGFSIAAIVIGVLLLAAGMFSVFDSEDINNSMVEVGTAQVVQNLVTTYPDTAAYASKTADIIEAAVEAREVDPDKLAELIYQAAEEYQSPGIKSLLVSIIRQINSAYAIAEKEEAYLKKLTYVVKGIREGVATAVGNADNCPTATES